MDFNTMTVGEARDLLTAASHVDLRPWSLTDLVEFRRLLEAQLDRWERLYEATKQTHYEELIGAAVLCEQAVDAEWRSRSQPLPTT
jgi:hypothetical protein